MLQYEEVSVEAADPDKHVFTVYCTDIQQTHNHMKRVSYCRWHIPLLSNSENMSTNRKMQT